MKTELTGNIFDIQKFSVIDGPGIRTTVFFKGCNLRCGWCHNPESQKKHTEFLFYESKCISCGMCSRVCSRGDGECTLCGKCTQYCPVHAREICGTDYTADKVLKEILTDKRFYDTSGGGVTFSGGECMLQIDFLEEILRSCKEEKIHTAVDTAGCVPWEYFQRLLPFTDLFLYDLKCFTEALHKKETGVSNRLILKNLEKLSNETDTEIIIRIPVIPGFNADDREMERMAQYLSKLRIRDVELLPYHPMGENKYAALGVRVPVFRVPDDAQMTRFRSFFAGTATMQHHSKAESAGP